MKHVIASIILCFCLINQSVAANGYYYKDSDWRSLPFIEMMATMMKIMNNILGGNNSYYGLNTLPYSPAYMPYSPLSMNNYLSGLNNLPMSPTTMGNIPFNNLGNRLPENFQGGTNAWKDMNNFWEPATRGNNPLAPNPRPQAGHNLNGIWQALSGDVIAIYKDNYFIWSDGHSRNLAGRLMIKDNILYAYIPASKVTLQFQFFREPGQFVVRDKTSRIYTFKRLH